MRIALFHASAGHGHSKIAEVIYQELLRNGVSEKDIFMEDALDETPAWFKKVYTGIYYYSVKHIPKVWGWAYEMADHRLLYPLWGQHFRRMVNRSFGEGLLRRVRQEKPDVIICTHFMAPEILGWEKARGGFSSHLVTVITDFYPHAFWVNPGTDHYWVMSDEGKKDLEGRGVPSEKITAGGIPVSPKFRPAGKKKEIRRREGLEEDRFTILLTSGSFGLGPTTDLLETLREFGGQIQVMVVCGRNEAQLGELERNAYPFKTKLYGFVSNMDELMEASDLVVAKPGGSTTSEALAKGVPMVILEPIPGQEMGNARLLRERNAAFFLGNSSDIRIILKGILDYPEVLQEKRRALQGLAKPEAVSDLARFVLDRGQIS